MPKLRQAKQIFHWVELQRSRGAQHLRSRKDKAVSNESNVVHGGASFSLHVVSTAPYVCICIFESVWAASGNKGLFQRGDIL